MKVSPILAFVAAMISLTLFGCAHEEAEHEAHKITATNPKAESITITQPFVCQIHSQKHIQVKALERGYLEAINIKEGQKVEKDQELFKVIPVLYKTRFDAENAEARVAEMKYNYAQQMFKKNVVSENEVKLLEAEWMAAKAKAAQANAELNFATVRAQFDGIVDRLHHQQGSLVQEGEILSTLSDNSVMWVYFNVPEKQYLEYMGLMSDRASEGLDALNQELKIELVLASGDKFTQIGKISAIEADFNNQTGNIPFRADFPNPERLLRHGQTGTVLITRVMKNAIIIPQRATFPVLAKQYVYVIDNDNVAHQREIVYDDRSPEDLFIIKSGLTVNDKIVLEGIRQVRDGEKVEYEERQPEEIAKHLKYHAE